MSAPAGDGYDPGNPAHLVAAGLDWLASGERELPAVIAALPEEDRALLLGATREFGETLRGRLRELGYTDEEDRG